MDKAKCSLEAPYHSTPCLSSSVIAQNLSFLPAVGASLPSSCIMDPRGVDKFFRPDTQFAWIFDGAMWALVHSHYSTLHITARKSSSPPPPYEKLNKEGVIKLPATSLSPPLYLQILAQHLSDILGVINSFKIDRMLVLWIFQYLSPTREYYAGSHNLFSSYFNPVF